MYISSYMPRTDEDLTEIIQVRVSKTGLRAIEQRAKEKGLSKAASCRQALYIDAGMIKK